MCPWITHDTPLQNCFLHPHQRVIRDCLAAPIKASSVKFSAIAVLLTATLASSVEFCGNAVYFFLVQRTSRQDHLLTLHLLCCRRSWLKSKNNPRYQPRSPNCLLAINLQGGPIKTVHF